MSCRDSLTSHGGEAIGLTVSVLGRESILFAKGVLGRWVCRILLILIRSGCLGSKHAVRAANVWATRLSSISGGLIYASLYSTAVCVVLYTGRIDRIPVSATFSRCRMCELTWFEILLPVRVLNLPGPPSLCSVVALFENAV